MKMALTIRNSTSYLTNEQRSHAGWIGASKCEVIFERALSGSIEKNYRDSDAHR